MVLDGAAEALGEHVLHLRGTIPTRALERAVRRGVAVAADDRHTGL
jgi:hypothetical protein